MNLPPHKPRVTVGRARAACWVLCAFMMHLAFGGVSSWALPVAGDDPPAEPGPGDQVTLDEASQIKRDAERAFLSAFKENDFASAEDALLRWLGVDPRNFVPWYNLACVLSLQGKVEQAERMLTKAVTVGFSDRHTLENDPHIEALRSTETYKAIVEGWDRIITAQVEANLAVAKSRYTEGYTFEREESMRLAYVSAFDSVRMGQARAEIARLDRWWKQHVLPEEEPWRSGPRNVQHAWVMVLLPNARDFREWAAEKYGAAWERIGGEYSHDLKRLISKDLGSTLRHEYWHVLHWRHMDSLGQRHPAWIMEGLCSLVEDVADGPDGRMKPLPSWRTNQAKRLARLGSLMPLDVFFELQQSQFVRTRPLAQYAQARALFMYLYDQGKLREWYTTYVKNYREDRTGRLAFELTFEKGLRDIQRDLTVWLRGLPEVAESVTRGMAVLPVELESGASWTGGGLRIISYPFERQAGGLKFGDVVTSINGQSLHDLYDYARVLADLTPGQEVEVSYVRRGEHATTRLRLSRQR
ncbi:MAG: PDZ domain-containing protein [Phycisphaeraceae bacterium]|nr:PDZ domain-containing protein [Phycisphaeraceae bacterium]